MSNLTLNSLKFSARRCSKVTFSRKASLASPYQRRSKRYRKFCESARDAPRWRWRRRGRRWRRRWCWDERGPKKSDRRPNTERSRRFSRPDLRDPQQSAGSDVQSREQLSSRQAVALHLQRSGVFTFVPQQRAASARRRERMDCDGSARRPPRRPLV